MLGRSLNLPFEKNNNSDMTKYILSMTKEAYWGGYPSNLSFVRTDDAPFGLLSTLCTQLQGAFQSTCVGYFRVMLKIACGWHEVSPENETPPLWSVCEATGRGSLGLCRQPVFTPVTEFC